MPPKRKRSTNVDDSETKGLYLDASVHEDGQAAPKKRGRKSVIEAILQEEARGTPPPVLPQNQWTASIVHPQDLTQTTNTTKRRKVQSPSPSVASQKYPSPGMPPIWAANKGDFCSAFKSLTESFGGISCANLGTFLVLAWLVEGPRSPDDTLDGESLTLNLVTEFKPKAQPNASGSVGDLKKKGRQNRRTKRGDLTTVSTDFDNAANTSLIDPTPNDLKPAPQKQWPCLVRSGSYNADYPTFCECLQPDCSRHSPAARDILMRRCTEYSWPDPRIVGFNLTEERANCDPGAPTGDRKEDPSAYGYPSISSFRLPLSTAKMYAQVVPELASLLDHMERKDPVLVISTTDAKMDSVLPFQLPPENEFVVLGFFDVESVECESGNCPPTLNIQPGTLSWKVQLRYTPPSNATDAGGNVAPPWWLAAPTTLATPDVVGPSPLPAVPKSEDIKGEANGLGERATPADTRWCLIQALDGNPGRIWWYCAGCGRINQRDMLIHRRCRSCQRDEAPAPPFVFEGHTSTAPHPFNHAPRSMKPGGILVKNFWDRTNVYCYSFHDETLPGNGNSGEGASVKHIFTGHHDHLKREATGLFYQIQEGVELSWQSVKTGIAEGPYYTWASPRHGWVDKEIPQCIDQARDLVSQFSRKYGDGDPVEPHHRLIDEVYDEPSPPLSPSGERDENEGPGENIVINHVVALAWTASGSKRGTFITAMNSPVFILCLGATVELEFERYVSGEVVAVNAEDDSTVKGDVVVPEEKAGQKGKGKKPRKSQKNPAPGPSSETKVNGKESKKDKGKEKSMVSQPKPKPSAPNHERLKISMVHGDVLILRGGDFIYSLTRTRKSMSILLFAMSDAQY